MSELQIKDWKAKLPGCFGIMDLVFASHPLDRERATVMVNEAYHCGASFEEIATAIHDYLAEKGADKQHIERQIERAMRIS
jgi:hypothetical protein